MFLDTKNQDFSDALITEENRSKDFLFNIFAETGEKYFVL
jgi:hypothetical protein